MAARFNHLRYLVIAVAALCVATWLSLPANSQETQQGSRQGQGQTGENQPDFPSWAFPVEIIERQTNAQARETREERAEQRELEDLAAQQRMDEATRKMADYAAYQTILVAVGTSLLFGTLWLTFQANKAATVAATESIKATKIMRVDQRAWVDIQVDGVALDIRNGLLVVEVVYSAKNHGRTPATEVECAVKVLDILKRQGSKTDALAFYDGQLDRATLGAALIPGEVLQQGHVTHTDVNDRTYTDIDVGMTLLALTVTYRYLDGEVGQTGKVVRLYASPTAPMNFSAGEWKRFAVTGQGNMYSRVI